MALYCLCNLDFKMSMVFQMGLFWIWFGYRTTQKFTLGCFNNLPSGWGRRSSTPNTAVYWDNSFSFTPCQKPYVPSNHFKTLLNFLVFKNVLVSIVTITISNEMFVRVLTVHCDQNNSYEITINGFQVRKINEIRNVIFGFRYGKPSSALRPKLGCSPSWVLDDIQRFLGQTCLSKHRFVTYVNSIEKSENNLQIPFFL